MRLRNGQLGASPSEVRDDQIKWVEALDAIDNVSACICYGWEEARDKILELEAM